MTIQLDKTFWKDAGAKLWKLTKVVAWHTKLAILLIGEFIILFFQVLVEIALSDNKDGKKEKSDWLNNDKIEGMESDDEALVPPGTPKELIDYEISKIAEKNRNDNWRY